MKEEDKKGSTLLELIVVLLIITILSTIAIPIFKNKSVEAKQITHNQNVGLLTMQGELYLSLLTEKPYDGKDILDDIVAGGYIREEPIDPLTGNKDYKVIYNQIKDSIEVTPGEVELTGVLSGEGGSLSELVFTENFTNETNKGAATSAKWIGARLGGTENEVLNRINNFGADGDGEFGDIIQDNEGNYVCVGKSQGDISIFPGGTNSQGGSDFIIAKFNDSFDLISIKNIGGIYYDEFKSIIQDNEGNYVCVGKSYSDLSSIGGTICQGPYSEFVIAKFDKNLGLISIKNLGGSSDDGFNNIIQDKDNNYVCVGLSKSDLLSFTGGTLNRGYNDAVIAKFNKDLGLIALDNIGGSWDEYFTSIIQDNDGNYLCVGQSGSDLDYLPGGVINQGYSGNFFVAKYNSDLGLISVKNIVGWYEERFNQIIQDNEGNYVCVGTTNSNNLPGITLNYDSGQWQDFGFIIAKLNNNLDLISMKEYGGCNYKSDELYDIIQDKQGNYICVGASECNLSNLPGGTISQGEYDSVIAMFNNNLDLISIKNIGGSLSEGLCYVIQDKNEDFVCAGTSNSDLSSLPGGTINQGGYYNFAIAKFTNDVQYNTTNNLLASKQMSLGSSLDNIKIKVEAVTPTGTSYIFSYSTDGITYIEVPSGNLDGIKDINIAGSSSIWWKIHLTGTTDATPVITGVSVYK